MTTIMRFEWIRKKKKLMSYWLAPLAVMLGAFLLSLLIERISPKFNATYMKWPDLLKDFLCLSGWSTYLWINIWRRLLLVYPFYLIITMMRETAASVTEEKRLETTVYLRNAGIPKLALPAAKLLFWGITSFIACALVTLAEILFAAALGYPQGIAEALVYGARLAGVLIVYLCAALFMAVCRTGSCDDTIVGWILCPWLISRVPALLTLFSQLLVMTGREGEAIEQQLNLLGKKTAALEMLSPLTWALPAMRVRGTYVVFAVLIVMVMLPASFAIYKKKDLV